MKGKFSIQSDPSYYPDVAAGQLISYEQLVFAPTQKQRKEWNGLSFT